MPGDEREREKSFVRELRERVKKVMRLKTFRFTSKVKVDARTGKK